MSPDALKTNNSVGKRGLMKAEKCSKEKTLVISEFDPITEKLFISSLC